MMGTGQIWPPCHVCVPPSRGQQGEIGEFVPWSLTTSWRLADSNARVQKVFNGHLRVTNENFLDAYENSNSTEFKSLANQVKEAVSLGPGDVLLPCPSQDPGRDSAHVCLQIPELGVGYDMGAAWGRGHFCCLAGFMPCPLPSAEEAVQ